MYVLSFYYIEVDTEFNYVDGSEGEGFKTLKIFKVFFVVTLVSLRLRIYFVFKTMLGCC